MAKKRSKMIVFCDRTPKAYKWENGKKIGYSGTKCYIMTHGRLRKCVSPVTGYKVKCVDVAEISKAPYGVPK